jgi:hypothetical protein
MWKMFQDLHKRAWDLMGSYLTANLRLFAGLAKEAESTVLLVVTSWCEESESFNDIMTYQNVVHLMTTPSFAASIFQVLVCCASLRLVHNISDKHPGELPQEWDRIRHPPQSWSDCGKERATM